MALARSLEDLRNFIPQSIVPDSQTPEVVKHVFDLGQWIGQHPAEIAAGMLAGVIIARLLKKSVNIARIRYAKSKLN